MNKENDAYNGVAHLGGESKEEIEAEDKWQEEQNMKALTMTNTEKILKQFDEKFLTLYGIPVIVDGELKESYELLNTKNGTEVKAFIATSIAQAIEEDRARGEIKERIKERIRESEKTGNIEVIGLKVALKILTNK